MVVTLPMEAISVFLLFTSLLKMITISAATDIIMPSQSLKDNETIVSADGLFELGFFRSGSSRNWYLGIWYHKLPIIIPVWVANRETPLSNSSGVFKISNQGNLLILNENGSIIWSSIPARSGTRPVAQLLDSGNLVVKDEGDNNQIDILWESFDYPGNTAMPDMRLGRNIKTGIDWYMSSWKTPSDPSPGSFTFELDPNGYPEFFLRNGSIKQFRTGPWNGVRFSGLPQLSPKPILTYEYVQNGEEIYFRYFIWNTYFYPSVVLTEDGRFAVFMRDQNFTNWEPYSSLKIDDCDDYAHCGAFGICDTNSAPLCSCLKGFLPKNPQNGDMVNWTVGCVRRTPLNCSEDGFQKYSGVKLPETKNSWFNEDINLEQCENICKQNCSCTAYTNLDIREGGSGCLLWFGKLIDIRTLNEDGQDIYIRLAQSELDPVENNDSNAEKQRKILLISMLVAANSLVGLALLLYIWRRKQQKNRKLAGTFEGNSNTNYPQKDLDLPLLDLDTIVSATDNFSITNKLGEGGFGPVYKGRLKDGQEIAVKRLSLSSTQGIDEFKNEVMHIAKLQHRNLVRLLGCCIQENEKMLIYEFMPNKSLDYFIFDETQILLLSWPTRYNIIRGIARGLLYLHHDSRLRIIHRDLKAGNILLDYEMTPKISDFGMARSFGGNGTDENTTKVVGTYGYISPEYAIHGHYSVKSDVFSFGVMVLEIVSGKRNSEFSDPDDNLNLLGHAWKLHNEGRSLELTDESVRESSDQSEVLQSVQVGLLCVQQNPEDRPCMSSVVCMLGGEDGMPQPKQPAFFTQKDIVWNNPSASNHEPCSVNNLTITLVEAR